MKINIKTLVYEKDCLNVHKETTSKMKIIVFTFIKIQRTKFFQLFILE